MIRTKEDLKYYMACDKVAMSRKGVANKWDLCYYFVTVLRKYEYWYNQNGTASRVVAIWYHLKFKKISEKCGFTIPINCIGPGLCLPHYGTIVISEYVKIGNNCKIHVGVNIGATNGKTEAKTIGDNVYLAPGCKIIGGGSIGKNVVVGANAVVIGNVESGITVGGIPAKKISDRNSSDHLIRVTEIILRDRLYE